MLLLRSGWQACSVQRESTCAVSRISMLSHTCLCCHTRADCHTQGGQYNTHGNHPQFPCAQTRLHGCSTEVTAKCCCACHALQQSAAFCKGGASTFDTNGCYGKPHFGLWHVLMTGMAPRVWQTCTVDCWLLSQSICMHRITVVILRPYCDRPVQAVHAPTLLS